MRSVQNSTFGAYWSRKIILSVTYMIQASKRE